jgi:hypothetical protein
MTLDQYDRLSSEGLSRLASAECYIVGLKLIIDNRGEQSDATVLTELPANTLAGFALELLLKGHLLIQGMNSHTVKRIGHNIDELIAEARKRGLRAVDGLDDLAGSLGKGHADFTYRYLESGQDIDLFYWDRVYGIFDDLIDAIKVAMPVQTPA